MTLNLWTQGELGVTTFDYIKGVLEDLPDVIIGRRMRPEDNNIFQVRPEDKRMILNE